MSLSDPRYIVFLMAAVFCLGLARRENYRQLLVLSFSACFIVLLDSRWYVALFLGLASFAGALIVNAARTDRARDASFLVVLVILLGPLAFYKYLPSVSWVQSALAGHSFVLPIGISFYTFAAVGYLIDVYVEKTPAERRPLKFLNFLFFFPSFSAGPIERADHLIPQLDGIGATFRFDRSVLALQLILLGLFYKVVVADSLAPHVDLVYADSGNRSAADLFVATFLFAFQVYCDFAGYSLVAIGSALLLGVELLPNFKQPYLSSTVAEFWRRWHISLSGWFRDYVFTPLHFKFRKRGKAGMAAALIFSFVLVGLWHGSGGKFVIFGLLHGILVALSTFTLAWRNRFWKRLNVVPDKLIFVSRIAITFSVVCATLVLFRATTLSDALSIYEKMVSFDLGARTVPLRFPLLVILGAIVCEVAAYRRFSVYDIPTPLRWALYYVGLISIIYAAVAHVSDGIVNAQQFIYFKF